MTSASLTSMAISGGASSSSYSSAWRRSRSGEGRRSESGPEPVGDAGAGLGCAVSRAWKANGGCTDLFPKRSDMAASSSSECISMSSEGRVDGGRSRAPARLDMAVLGGSRMCWKKLCSRKRCRLCLFAHLEQRLAGKLPLNILKRQSGLPSAPSRHRGCVPRLLELQRAPIRNIPKWTSPSAHPEIFPTTVV